MNLSREFRETVSLHTASILSYQAVPPKKNTSSAHTNLRYSWSNEDLMTHQYKLISKLLFQENLNIFFSAKNL